MTTDQFHLAIDHLPAAHRFADDVAGLFPGKSGELRGVAERALLGAAETWLPGCTLSFEGFLGYRVRGALMVHTQGWRAEG